MMSSKLKTSIQAVNRAIAFCGVAGAVALAGAVPLAQAAEGDKEREIQEVIVVKGVKGSLQRALQIKRNASSIVDAISAEDIGDFPDENIAESLQRISGVTIERERGEGSRISIRGLGPNFNLTLLNEQRIASSNLFEDEQPSRGFNYSLLASEVIASAEVYKSPEAWFDEGGVGGTVILRTRKPLDLDKPLLSIRLEGGYSDLADEYDPRFSFTAGSKFGNDKWGFLISGVKTERTVRNDATGPLSFSQRPVDLNSDGVLDFGTVPAGTPDPSRGFGDDPNATATVTGINAVDANGNPVIQGIQSAEGLFQPDLLGNTFFVSVRERTGASGALQFQPNEQLQFSLTGLYSELTDNGVNNNLLLLPTRLAGTLGAVVTPVNNASIVGNTLVAGTIPQRITNLGNFTGNRGNVITTALDSFDRDAQIDTFAIDLETEWQDASETWKVVSHIGVTEATTDSTNRFLETVTFGEQTFDLRVGENGSQSVPQDLTNPAGQPFGFASFQTLEQENEQAYASIDITYTLDSENIDSIRFGAKYRTQSQNRVRVLSQATNSTSDGGSVFALGLSSFNPMPTPDDFLSGGFEDGINAFQFSDPAFVDDILSGDFGDESVFVRQPNNEDFFDIEEDITSLFGQVNFSTSEKWRGNAGIRVIRIERDSLANELFQGTVTPFEQRSTQTEVLPSFNLIYDVNENFVTRFALSRTLALPTFADISPTRLITLETQSILTGNPDLDPFAARAADVSFEYYYGEGNAISLGLFYKDIESFFAPVSAIDNTPGQFNGFTVTRPENIGSGSIRGLELAYLHNFDHLPGLLKHTGVQANYTYSDTSSGAVDQQTGRDISLPGQSDNTANASLFFDNGKVSSRLAWAWRDEFFTGVSNGNAVIVGQTRQLDWNINYNITDQLAVFVEGINLTDENTADVFAGTEERILGQGRFGRRFFFGVNYKL